MKFFTFSAAAVLIICTTSCASSNSTAGHGMSSGDVRAGERHAYGMPPMDPTRVISEQDCRNAFSLDGANLRCR
jgi:hypothetical protein